MKREASRAAPQVWTETENRLVTSLVTPTVYHRLSGRRSSEAVFSACAGERRPQLAQGARLHVTYPFARHPELLRDLLQRVHPAVEQSEPLLDHELLLRLERLHLVEQLVAVERA